jgi:hypothetical protein
MGSLVAAAVAASGGPRAQHGDPLLRLNMEMLRQMVQACDWRGVSEAITPRRVMTQGHRVVRHGPIRVATR